MKYVKEIVIIFGITMVGELLNKFIPLPVPAGVYGLFILLGGLCSGIIKLSDVEVTGNLLLDLMPVMFIPAAVLRDHIHRHVHHRSDGRVDHQETEERGEIEMPLYFGVFVSLFAYLIGMELKKKFGWPVLNPLLVAIILVIAFLKATGITYTDYNEGASYISYFLTPATVCLAIPLYKQLELLKRNLTAVATAITAGVIGSVVSVYVMSMVFKLEHVHYVSLLPKSITTAIGMGVSEEAGGIVTMTIVSIIIPGILGNIVADGWFKLIGIKEPIAKGLALGTSAHAIGTAKALELGEVEGAMSSLSIAVAGLMTVVSVPIMSGLI